MIPSTLAVALLAVLSAGPDGPPPAPARPSTPPGPAKELEALQPFEGAWTCEAMVPAPGAGPAQVIRSEMTLRRDLGGFWYAGRWVQEPTAERPQPLTRLFFWTYDPVLWKFAGGWLDDRGGWSAQTSPGWEDGRLTWIGHVTLTGQKATAREIYTPTRPGEFLHVHEVLDFTSWTRIAEERCRRPQASSEAPPAR